MTSRLFTQAEAAEWLGISPRTLEDFRYRGNGPVFVKLGRKLVRYRPDDLERFISEGARTNTGGGVPD